MQSRYRSQSSCVVDVPVSLSASFVVGGLVVGPLVGSLEVCAPSVEAVSVVPCPLSPHASRSTSESEENDEASVRMGRVYPDCPDRASDVPAVRRSRRE